MTEDPPRQSCVLVVDDHASNRELVARVLTAAGYMVETAGDPREALQVLGRRQRDLYVVDFVMPGMTSI